VELDGFGRDAEGGGDLFGGAAFGDELEDFALAGGEVDAEEIGRMGAGG
jgi:hypothetical protein